MSQQDMGVGDPESVPNPFPMTKEEVDIIRLQAQKLLTGGDPRLICVEDQAITTIRLCQEIERLHDQLDVYSLYVTFYRGTTRGFMDRFGDTRPFPVPPHLPPLEGYQKSDHDKD